MRLHIIALTLFWLFVSSPAIADIVDPSTIGGMRSACEIHKTVNANSKASDIFNAGICNGWAMSEVMWRKAACVFVQEGLDPGSLAVRAARDFEGHSRNAVVQAFLNWSDANPQLWSQLPVFTSVDTSLFADFPRKSGN